MKLIRTIVFTVSLVLLGAGYAASQVAYSESAATGSMSSLSEYAARIDSPPVQRLALGLLVCCLVFPFIGKPSEASER